MTNKNPLGRIVGLIAAALLCANLVHAQSELPDQTEDGLKRIETKSVQALYWQPGASLASYKRIKILDCFVAFHKDWQREQNSGRVGARRVTADDMDRIKTVLADEFRKVFTDELQAKGGYEIVDTTGEDVLLLRPALVNLDVNAPDLPAAGRTRTYVTSAGSMTLYLELFDSATSSLIGRAIDSRAARDTGTVEVASSVTNRAEADRILRRWAGLLRSALDEQWSAPK